MLATLTGEGRDMMLFALLTGMRYGELRRVKPEHLDGDVLTVIEKVHRAQDKYRQIVLTPPVMTLFARAIPFRSRHSKTYAEASASLAMGSGNLTLRDARAAFATAADKAGDSRATDMAMGHSGVPSRYQKTDYDRLRAVAQAVLDWLGGDAVGAYSVTLAKRKVRKTVHRGS